MLLDVFQSCNVMCACACSYSMCVLTASDSKCAWTFIKAVTQFEKPQRSPVKQVRTRINIYVSETSAIQPLLSKAIASSIQLPKTKWCLFSIFFKYLCMYTC